MRHDTFQIIPQLAHRYAQCLDTARMGPSTACSVSVWRVATVVRKAIDLDCQPGCVAIEIKYIRTERVLAAELQTFGPCA